MILKNPIIVNYGLKERVQRVEQEADLGYNLFSLTIYLLLSILGPFTNANVL